MILAPGPRGRRGDRDARQRTFESHRTPLEHWVRVGDLRRRLAGRGVSVSTADAHVAQCALEREAVLLSRDAIFARIAEASELRLQRG